MDWSSYYPAYTVPIEDVPNSKDQRLVTDGSSNIRPLVKDVEVADIGCGFGGLLVALGPRLPDKLLLG